MMKTITKRVVTRKFKSDDQLRAACGRAVKRIDEIQKKVSRGRTVSESTLRIRFTR